MNLGQAIAVAERVVDASMSGALGELTDFEDEALGMVIAAAGEWLKLKEAEAIS